MSVNKNWLNGWEDFVNRNLEKEVKKEQDTLNTSSSRPEENKEVENISQNKTPQEQDDGGGIYVWAKRAIAIKLIFAIVVTVLGVGFINAVINFIAVLTGTFLPKATSTTISFYSADSFYGLPIKVTENALTVPEIGASITDDDIKEAEERITKKMQERLKTLYPASDYRVRLSATGSYQEKETFYPTLFNVSEGTEGITSIGLHIKDGENGMEEGIYYYSSLNETGFLTGLKSYFGSDMHISGYKHTDDEKKNIYFLQNTKGNMSSYQAFENFVSMIREGKKNDGSSISEANKPAFMDVLKLTGKVDSNDYNLNLDAIAEYGQDGLVFYMGSNNFCWIKLSNTENEDLDCFDGRAIVRLTDEFGNRLSLEELKKKNPVIKNVQSDGTDSIINDLKDYISMIRKRNQTTLSDSYLVDMLNFVGTHDGNSNQKILSQEKVNLEFFSKKRVGKTDKGLLLPSSEIQKFTIEDAKAILEYKEADTVIDSKFSAITKQKNNKYQIYKVDGGFATDSIKNPCFGTPLVYPNVDAMTGGFTYTSNTKTCKTSFNAPPILEIGDVEFYKEFNFVGDIPSKTGVFDKIKQTITGLNNVSNTAEKAMAVTRKKEDYKLNFFYHYTMPESVTVENSDVNSIVNKTNNISQISHEKKSILWKGIYLKVSGFAVEVKDEKTGEIDVKRDSRDGLPLVDSLPMEFQIGLLTQLDDKEQQLYRNKKGEISIREVEKTEVQDFKAINKQFANNTNKKAKISFGNLSISLKGALMKTVMNRLNDSRFQMLYENYSEKYGESFNTFFALYKNESVLDSLSASDWYSAIRGDEGDEQKKIELVAPRYIQKKKDDYVNNFLDNRNLQKRFVTVLDETYYGIKGTKKEGETPSLATALQSWTLTDTGAGTDITTDASATTTTATTTTDATTESPYKGGDIVMKYLTLFSTLETGKDENKDKLSNFICRQYKLAENLSKQFKHSSYIAATLENTDIYTQCYQNYSDEVELGRSFTDIEREYLEEKKKRDASSNNTGAMSNEEFEKLNQTYKALHRLDLTNTLTPIVPKMSFLMDETKNDLYKLYKLFKDKNVMTVTVRIPYIKGSYDMFTEIWAELTTNDDGTFLYSAYSSKMSFYDFVEGIFLNDSETENNKSNIEILKALYKKGQEIAPEEFPEVPLDNDSIMKNFLEKMTPENKAFYLFEYKGYEVDPVKYDNADTVIKNLKYKAGDTPFFNIRAGFSFDREYYDAERDLHKMYINPNVYLFSYFKGLKRDSKAYTVSVENEDALWFYPAAVTDKYLLDSQLMYSYAHNISKNILTDLHIKTYGSATAQIYKDVDFKNDEYTRGDSMTYVNPTADIETLKWLSLNTTNDMAKYNIVANYMQNIQFYRKLATRNYKIPYQGNTFNVNLSALKKKKDEQNQRIAYAHGVLNVIPRMVAQLDTMMAIKLIEAELAVYDEKVADEKLKIDRLTYERDFLYKFWVALAGYADKNTSEDTDQNIKLRNVINSVMLKDVSPDDKGGVISKINAVTQRVFGYGFEPTSSYWNAIISFNKDNIVLDDLSPKVTESKIDLSIDPAGLKDNPLLKLNVGEDGRYNKFIVGDIGHPFNRNAQHSNPEYAKSYIDHAALRDVFAPMINYTGSILPAGSTIVSSPSAGVGAFEAEVLGHTLVLPNEENSPPTTPTDTTSTGATADTSTETGSGTVTDTGSGSTTGSGTTASGSTTEGTSVNLTSGGVIGWFESSDKGMELKNYSEFIDNSVIVTRTAGMPGSPISPIYYSDAEKVLKDIARLELFYGKNEIVMQTTQVGLSQGGGADFSAEEVNALSNANNPATTTTSSGAVTTPTTSSGATNSTSSGSVTGSGAQASAQSIRTAFVNNTMRTTFAPTSGSGATTETTTSSGSTTVVDTNSGATLGGETLSGTTATGGLLDQTSTNYAQGISDILSLAGTSHNPPKLELKNANVQIEYLYRMKQCMEFIEKKDTRLHTALFDFQLKFDEVSHSDLKDKRNSGLNYRKFSYEPFGLSFDERKKIFDFLVVNKELLLCGDGVTGEEYKIYLDYVAHNMKKIVDDMNKYDAGLIKSYKLYDGITYLNLPASFTFSKDSGVSNGNPGSVKEIPLFKMLEHTFTNLTSKARESLGKKATYKFVQTTDKYAFTFDNFSFGYKTDDWKSRAEMAFIYNSNIVATLIADNMVLYDGMVDLTKEFQNYTKSTDVKSLEGFSELRNLGPFYYLFANNGYIDPEKGIKFEVIDVAQQVALGNAMFAGFDYMNADMLLMDPSMYEAYGEKAAVNAYLDTVDQKLCSTKAGNEQIKCKNYITFLKNMDMASYKQEIEYLTYLIAANKITGAYAVGAVSTGGVWPLPTFHSKIRSRIPDFYTKYINESYTTDRASPYVGQCTWFAQLFKDMSNWGHGRVVVSRLRWVKGVVVESYDPRNPTEALKTIRAGDVISFYGYNMDFGCAPNSTYGHVGMVIATNPTKQTITVAEGNAVSYFKSNVTEYHISKICRWEVAHGVKARYGNTDVLYGRGNNVMDILAPTTGTTTPTASGATAPAPAANTAPTPTTNTTQPANP